MVVERNRIAQLKEAYTLFVDLKKSILNLQRTQETSSKVAMFVDGKRKKHIILI